NAVAEVDRSGPPVGGSKGHTAKVRFAEMALTDSGGHQRLASSFRWQRVELTRAAPGTIACRHLVGHDSPRRVGPAGHISSSGILVVSVICRKPPRLKAEINHSVVHHVS